MRRHVPPGIPARGPLPIWKSPDLEAALDLLAMVGVSVWDYDDPDDPRLLWVWSVRLEGYSPPPGVYPVWPVSDWRAVSAASDWLERQGVPGSRW